LAHMCVQVKYQLGWLELELDNSADVQDIDITTTTLCHPLCQCARCYLYQQVSTLTDRGVHHPIPKLMKQTFPLSSLPHLFTFSSQSFASLTPPFHTYSPFLSFPSTPFRNRAAHLIQLGCLEELCKLP